MINVPDSLEEKEETRRLNREVKNNVNIARTLQRRIQAESSSVNEMQQVAC